MGFLAPHFAHDVFVSYSHGDPRGTSDSPLRRWTIALVRELKAEIQSVDTEFDSLDVWCDEHLDPTAHLTPELRDIVKSSGILMIAMSPRYLSSTWCKDELDWFREQIKDRSRDQGRVFIIRVLPTDESKWPDFLCDERGKPPVGFRFYDPQSNMPYGWRDVREQAEEYPRQLWTLQTSLTKRLRELRSRLQSRAAALTVPAAEGMGRRIYLHARPEYARLRDEVRSQLVEDGMTPLSRVEGSGTGLDDWVRESKARIEAAKRCQALALVRAEGDEAFVGDLLDIGIDERERIRAARGAPLPCAVLDRSGESLPIDISPFGIRRFDLSSQNWRGEFRAWVDAAQPVPGVA
jgi:hypothetical protein